MQSAGKCLPPLNYCSSADIAVSCGVSAIVTTCPLLQCWDLPYHCPTPLCGEWAKLMQCGLGIFREVCPYSIQPQSSNWLFWNWDLTPEIPERLNQGAQQWKYNLLFTNSEVEWGDPSTLSSIGEAISGELCSVLGSKEQETRGHTGHTSVFSPTDSMVKI